MELQDTDFALLWFCSVSIVIKATQYNNINSFMSLTLSDEMSHNNSVATICFCHVLRSIVANRSEPPPVLKEEKLMHHRFLCKLFKIIK